MSCEVVTTIPNENAMGRNGRKGKEIHVREEEKGRKKERCIRKGLHYNQ